MAPSELPQGQTRSSSMPARDILSQMLYMEKISQQQRLSKISQPSALFRASTSPNQVPPNRPSATPRSFTLQNRPLGRKNNPAIAQTAPGRHLGIQIPRTRPEKELHTEKSMDHDPASPSICHSPTWAPRNEEKMDRKAAPTRPTRRLNKQPPPAAMETQRMPAALTRPPLGVLSQPTATSQDESRPSSRASGRRRSSISSLTSLLKMSTSFLSRRGSSSRPPSLSEPSRPPSPTEPSRPPSAQIVSHESSEEIDSRTVGRIPLSSHPHPYKCSDDEDDSYVRDLADFAYQMDPAAKESLELATRTRNRMSKALTPSTLPPSRRQGTDTHSTMRSGVMPLTSTTNVPRASKDGPGFVQKQRTYQEQRSIAGYTDEIAVKRGNEHGDTAKVCGPILPPTPAESIESVSKDDLATKAGESVPKAVSPGVTIVGTKDTPDRPVDRSQYTDVSVKGTKIESKNEVIVEGVDGDGLVRETSIKRPRSDPELSSIATKPPVPSSDFLPDRHQAFTKPKRTSPVRVTFEEAASLPASQFPATLSRNDTSLPVPASSLVVLPKKPFASSAGRQSHSPPPRRTSFGPTQPVASSKEQTASEAAGSKPVAKMFVICCKCQYWHDLPSKLYEAMALPRSAGKKDGEEGRMKGQASTAVKCPWCEHGLSTACCAGWTTIVYLHERHH